jgi:hypothetical protein
MSENLTMVAHKLCVLVLRQVLVHMWVLVHLSTSRNVAICDDLLVTPLTFVTEWYVICDEISIFVIGAK